ncbi:MAG: hypothetical protein KKE20_04670 [Nanoarchaeota archaeon]|nr:hypothetical protein [Nanoarchaeota archaeon]
MNLAKIVQKTSYILVLALVPGYYLYYSNKELLLGIYLWAYVIMACSWIILLSLSKFFDQRQDTEGYYSEQYPKKSRTNKDLIKFGYIALAFFMVNIIVMCIYNIIIFLLK